MVEMALRSTFSVADAVELDEIIQKHQKLFLQVRNIMCNT